MRAATGLVLIAIAQCAGQVAPPGATPGNPAPEDARAIVVRSIAATEHNDRLTRNYTWKQRTEATQFDGAGNAKPVETEVQAILFFAGKRYSETLEKNGKPLAGAELTREKKKLDRAAAEAAALTPAQREERMQKTERDRERQREMFREAPDAFDFTLAGEKVVDGHAAWRVLAVPNRSYRGRYENVLGKIQGTILIEKKNYQWVGFDLEVLDNISFGMFLARVDQGTHLTLEMARINDELWAPKHFAMRASVRVLAVKRFHVMQSTEFSDYRKFQSDSRIVATEEVR